MDGFLQKCHRRRARRCVLCDHEHTMVTGKRKRTREPENHGDKNPLVGELKSKGVTPQVSARVSPMLILLPRRRPQAGSSRTGALQGTGPYPKPFHTATARLPDPKPSGPLTSWAVLGKLLALASVPHHEAEVVAAPDLQGDVWSDWEVP